MVTPVSVKSHFPFLILHISLEKSYIDKCKWEGNFPSGLWWITEVRGASRRAAYRMCLARRKAYLRPRHALRMGSFLVENESIAARLYENWLKFG